MAQDEIVAIPFVAYWSIGDSYSYDVTKTTRNWKNGEITKDEEEHYVATFNVIDSTESTYTCRWTYENDLKNTYDIPEYLMDEFEKYEFTNIEYTTDEFGTFIELLNWEEIGEMMGAMTDAIVDYYATKNPDLKDNMQAALSPMKDIYSSQQGIEQLVLKEIQYFHFPMGVSFDPNETLEYEDELPNFLGGKPLRANAKIYFDYVNEEDGFCIFMHEMEVNEEDAKSLVSQMMKSMDLKDKDVSKLIKEAVFKISDYKEFEYFYDPGIPQNIEAVREVNLVMGGDIIKKLDELKMSIIFEE